MKRVEFRRGLGVRCPVCRVAAVDAQDDDPVGTLVECSRHGAFVVGERQEQESAPTDDAWDDRSDLA